MRAAGNALGSVGNRVLRRRPGGAETRPRPAQRRASERRAFRKGKFPTKGPRGSRPSESELAPSFGVRSRLSRAPSPQGFLSLAWLQAWSARGWSGGEQCRNAVGQAAPEAKVRPAGRAGGDFQRRTRASEPAVSHTLQLPASRSRVPTLMQAVVASLSFAFVSRVIHDDLFPNPRPMRAALAPRCQDHSPKPFTQRLERSSNGTSEPRWAANAGLGPPKGLEGEGETLSRARSFPFDSLLSNPRCGPQNPPAGAQRIPQSNSASQTRFLTPGGRTRRRINKDLNWN